jgi:YVTN family beta-propeller protein
MADKPGPSRRRSSHMLAARQSRLLAASITNSASLLASLVSLAEPAFAGAPPIATVPVGQADHWVAVDRINHHVYATAAVSNNVSVIDQPTNTVTATIAVGNGPVGEATDETRQLLYVANFLGNTLSVIDET